MADFLINLAISAAAVAVLLGVVFAISVRRDRHDLIETVGDWQLSRFKADPANKGKLMTSGLWRYTRHPNYFGDAAAWTGLYLLACGSWAGAATILSPVAMIWLLARGSGKPLTEKH